MNDNVTSYLESIDFPQSVKDRTAYLYDEMKNIFGENKLDDIFISNKKAEGNILYTSLWFISDQGIIECHDFLEKDLCDIAPLGKSITYIKVDKNYKLETCDTNSQLTIEISFNTSINLSCSFTAIGDNCNYLMDLTKKYFIPNRM